MYCRCRSINLLCRLLLDVIWAQPLTACLTLSSYFWPPLSTHFANFVDSTPTFAHTYREVARR